MRLILYKRIAAATANEDLREIQVEMIDRFGLLPPQVNNLFMTARLRIKADQLGIAGIEVGPQGGNIDFKESTRINPLSLVKLVQSNPKSYKLAGATRLRFEQDLANGPQREQFVEQLLSTFATEATEDAA